MAESAKIQEERLAEDLEREQRLTATKKDFVAASDKLDAWLAAADDLVQDNTHGPGTDLATVERKQDAFAAQYTNQASDQDALLNRIAKYTSQLEDGRHPNAEQCRASNDALAAKMVEIKEAAVLHGAALDAARAREARLVTAHKAFHEKKSRVMEWCDATHQLMALNENQVPLGLERGCGLVTVESRVDAFSAEYQLQVPVINTLVSEMQSLSEELKEGCHAEAEAVAEQQAVRRTDVEGLASDSVEYEEELTKILARENDLVATQKQFKAGASKLETWLATTLALTNVPEEKSEQAFGPSHNVEDIELLSDTFAEQHTNKIESYQTLLNELSDKAGLLGDGGHQYGPAATSQVDELRTQIAEARNNASKYEDELRGAMERENILLGNLKKFNSLERRIGAWTDACSGMVTVRDYGLGVNLKEIKEKMDVYTTRYATRVDGHKETLEHEMSDLVYSLMDGEHSSGEGCRERLDGLSGRVSGLEDNASTYLSEITKAQQREQELEKHLKAFRAVLQRVEAWVESCNDRVLADEGEGEGDGEIFSTLFLPGTDLTSLESSRDMYVTGYASVVPKNGQDLMEMQSLCKLLESGKHAESGACVEFLDGAKEKVVILEGRASSYLEKLDAATMREEELEEVLKTVRENVNTVGEWSGLMETLALKKEHDEEGCGVAKIEGLLDEYDDDFTNQDATMESLLGLIEVGVGQLKEGKHSSGVSQSENVSTLQERVGACRNGAKEYEILLRAALVRESDLAKTLKRFNSSHAGVSSWIETCGTTIGNDDFGKGVDLEAIEIRRDAFDTDFNAQLPAMQESLTVMETDVQKLEEGKHSDRESARERLGALTQSMADLTSGAESFKFALELAQTREDALVKALKMFNTQHGRTSAWCDACTTIVASDDSSPGAGTDLQSVETALDMFKFKYEAPSTSHRSKLKQLQTLHDQITDGQHASSDDVREKLADLTGRMAALSDAASTYKKNVDEGLERESSLDSSKKDFDAKSDMLASWMKTVSNEIGTTKAGKRRRGSVLVMPTAIDMAAAASGDGDGDGDGDGAGSGAQSTPKLKQQGFQGIGPGVGYDAVEHKLDVFKNEYTSQVENHNLLGVDLSSLALVLEEGYHEDASDCTEQGERMNQELVSLKGRANVYLNRLNEALEREATLNQTLQHYNSKAATVETWLDSVDQMLGEEDKVGRRSSIDPSKPKLDLNALEANRALLDAEYGQNLDRMQDVEVKTLVGFCDALTSGKHVEATSSVERLDAINMRMVELPERAESYRNKLDGAMAKENEYLTKKKELGIKVNEFHYSCKQLEEENTSPLSGLVFSVASAEEALVGHQEKTAEQLDDLETKFVSLQEAETYLETVKPGSINQAGDQSTSSLRPLVDACKTASSTKTSDLEELLRLEREKEELRVAFAHAANDVRSYVDEKTQELGLHSGTLQSQLESLESLQEDYAAKESDMEEARVASKKQDEAGVVVNSHTPETVETLSAAWSGLGGVYTKASEAIASQILAEQTAGLTPEQIAEANDVFDEFDVDKGGDLNLQEFHDCCTSLGLLLEKEEASVKHAQLDSDGSGRIDRKEFLQFYADELTHRFVFFFLCFIFVLKCLSCASGSRFLSISSFFSFPFSFFSFFFFFLFLQ